MISGLRNCLLMSLLACCWGAGPAALAAERITFDFHEQRLTLDGRMIVRTDDGTRLLQTPNGVLWAIAGADILDEAALETPFTPLKHEALAAEVLADLPPGFECHQTAHYVICHNTDRAYAQWCGGLFERLYMAFTNYWKRQGFPLQEPEFPLVAIVFADRGAFVKYAADELGEASDSVIGYYSLRTNRMTMYDLTGIATLRQAGDRRGSTTQINEMLARPAAAWTVATIVHEATHQIAFNSGLQTRYADIPLWVSEGLAVYFETPDLSSSRGWRTIGQVNDVRLRAFREYLPQRPADSLLTLLQDDERFRNSRTATTAYAEAWALNYYLLRQRRSEYQDYLRRLAEKPPLGEDAPQQRLAEFRAAFGQDLPAFDQEFLRAISRLR